MERLDAAVIGGGITGLACALQLEGTNYRVYEGGAEPGGIIRTAHREGFLLEAGPDAFLNEKPDTYALIRRLGLEGEVISVSDASPQRSFVLHKGRLHAVPEGTWLIAPTRLAPFFRSDLFSLRGKLRAGLEMFIPPRDEDEDESVASFIRRRFGSEMLKRIGEPMVAGIYGGDAETLSARTVLARFCELERRYGGVIEGLKEEITARGEDAPSGPRYSLFLSMKRGMGTLVDGLRARLDGRIETNAEVESLERPSPAGPWTLRFKNRPPVEARKVCLALPAPASAKLLKPAHPELAELLSRVHYESVLTVNLAFDRSAIGHKLDGFGFVVPRAAGLKLIGCSFSSVKFEGRAPEGKTLLRAFAGPLAGSDEAVVSILFSELKPLLSIRGEPLFWQVNRHPGAMPQYRVGHAGLVRSIREAEAAVPGLALAGNAFGGVGLSDCVREGEAAASVILSGVKRREGSRDSSAPAVPQNDVLVT